VNHIEESAQTARSNTEDSVAYFYCLYRKGTQHSLAAILRTLIAQLCLEDRIPTSLQKLYDLHSKKFPPGVGSDDEIKQIFYSMLHESKLPEESPGSSSTPQKKRAIYLLVDALDELPIGSQRDEILRFLAQLPSLGMPNIHILVTSRDESDIKTLLVGRHSWDSLPIDKSKVAIDMRKYVANEINKHAELSLKSSQIKSQIMHRLVDEGYGMYVVENLSEQLNPHVLSS
jgi:hypothetical protein